MLISNSTCIATRSGWPGVRTQQDERRRTTITATAKSRPLRIWRGREEVIFLNAIISINLIYTQINEYVKEVYNFRLIK